MKGSGSHAGSVKARAEKINLCPSVADGGGSHLLSFWQQIRCGDRADVKVCGRTRLKWFYRKVMA